MISLSETSPACSKESRNPKRAKAWHIFIQYRLMFLNLMTVFFPDKSSCSAGLAPARETEYCRRSFKSTVFSFSSCFLSNDLSNCYYIFQKYKIYCDTYTVLTFNLQRSVVKIQILFILRDLGFTLSGYVNGKQICPSKLKTLFFM